MQPVRQASGQDNSMEDEVKEEIEEDEDYRDDDFEDDSDHTTSVVPKADNIHVSHSLTGIPPMYPGSSKRIDPEESMSRSMRK